MPVKASLAPSPAESAATVVEEPLRATHDAVTAPKRVMLPALIGLRFFAATSVILFHTALGPTLAAHGKMFASNIVTNGFQAVALFFVLSGFVLAYNYRHRIVQLSDVFGFWEARYARIWPAYAFSLLCSSIPLSSIPPWPVAFATIAMVQAWNSFNADIAGAWNMVCWSLSVEAFFYLFFPFLQKAIEKLSPWGLVLLSAILVTTSVIANTSYYRMNLRYSGVFFYLIVPIIRLPEFVTGIVLGNLFLDSANPQQPAVTYSIWQRASIVLAFLRRHSVLTWTGLAGSLLALGIASGENRPCWEVSVSFATFALLIFGLASERSVLARFLSIPPLILGGEISYSMYLLRTPLHAWINLVPQLGQNQFVKWLYIPFALIPLSLFSYYVIEGPSRRGLRRLFARLHALTP